MDYVEELKSIPKLAATGEALASYAKSLIPGMELVKKGRLWVGSPHNFVAFEIQAARARQIRFTIYAQPYGFKRYAALSLWRARSSYWEFIVKDPRQLGPAAAYIARAAYVYSQKHKRSAWLEGIGEL